MRGRAIVSVHDVMPATFDKVRRIVALLDDAGVPPATLLVVPGKDWTPELLAPLKGLAQKGHALAGHGWVHKATCGPRTIFHQGHALLISRNEAEHLSRPREELRDLLRKCYEWFSGVGLHSPDLYVPPAWALGSLSFSDLRDLPFRWYEVLRGFVDAKTGRSRWLPLVGFEADTTFRKVSLRLWNGLNAGMARRVRGPLRISIHPGDLDLLLRADLEGMVRDPWTHVSEDEIMDPPRRKESP